MARRSAARAFYREVLAGGDAGLEAIRREGTA